MDDLRDSSEHGRQAETSGMRNYVIEEGFVTINSRKIKYLRTGCGPHAVLCCPGSLGTAWTDFKSQIFGLDRNKLTLVVWDPPGYGLSRPPGKDLKPDFYLRDANLALGLMESLKLPKFSILAWSAGTYPAFGMAATHPRNINKMVVWGSLAYVAEREVEALERIRDVNLWPESLRAKYIELYGLDEFRSLWEEWIDRLIRFGHEGKNGEIFESELLKKILCPVLILHGCNDPVVSLDQVQYLTRVIPGAKCQLFKNGKHNIHIQYHEEFNSAVMDFLSSQ